MYNKGSVDDHDVKTLTRNLLPYVTTTKHVAKELASFSIRNLVQNSLAARTKYNE